MKSIIKISSLWLFMMVAFSSCDKKLDIEPKQSVDAAVALTTADDVESAIVGAYSILGGGALYGTNLFMMADLQASENYDSWRGTFQGQRQIANKTMTRDNSEASRTWIAAYRAINMANIVIDALPVVKDAAQKTQLEGEALFIRGIMHFELVRYYALPWGATAGNTQPGVVIKTKATKDEIAAFEKIPRNTVAEVYQQVITDLTAAVSKLPADNGTRADKYTALAFLARVYLQKQDYANALAAANQVIASNQYKMNASVRAVFDNKNTAESIWEIQQNDQNNAGTSNDGMATFFASLPGIGRADVRINAAWVASYPDIARIDDIKDPITGNVIRRDTFPDARKSEWYYIGTGARPGNWYTSKWKSFSQNLPVIRIAEMYLTRAECNLRLGTNVGASPEDDYNRSRVRANYRPVSSVTLNEVLTERFLELAFEGLRIHDFKRLHLTTGSYAWDSPKLVFPIPQRDIDASEGILAQNPGY